MSVRETTVQASTEAPAAPSVVDAPVASTARPVPGLLRGVRLYLAALVAACAAPFWALQLWKLRPGVPLGYNGDSLLSGYFLKSLHDGPWFLHNDRVSAPWGLDLHDFPLSDHVHLFIAKLFSFVLPSYADTMNAYYLLGYPLAALTAAWALRRLGVNDWLALSAATLYTALPYHSFRGQSHLFLSAYWMVPLAILVCVRLMGEVPPLFERQADGRLRFAPRNRSSVFALAVAALMPPSGIYYAFITGFLLAFSSAVGALRHRQRAWIASGGILIGVLVLAVGCSLAPTLIFHARHGKNAAVVQRIHWESEFYALKPAQLVVPVQGHRAPRLARIREHYDRSPNNNENALSSLGLLGSIGFLLLVARGLTGLWPRRGDAVFGSLSKLNLATLALGTMGGIASVFALLVTPEIRAINRVSVFIAFFAFAAAAAGFQALMGRVPGAKRGPFLALSALLLTGFGVWDQSSPSAVPPYEHNTALVNNDRAFVAEIEAALPAGSSVFQAPPLPFPETPAVHRQGHYEPVRMYLQSRSLRWSYPAMTGREPWTQISAAGQKPPNELVPALRELGYRGLVLDRYALAAPDPAWEAELTRLTGRAGMEDGEKRLVFWPL